MSRPKLEHQITLGRLRANLSVTRGVAEPKHACVTLERRDDDASELFYPAATFRSADLDGLIQMLVEMRQYLTHPGSDKPPRPQPGPAASPDSNRTVPAPQAVTSTPTGSTRAAVTASAAPKPPAAPTSAPAGQRPPNRNGQGRHAPARPKRTRPVVAARARSSR